MPGPKRPFLITASFVLVLAACGGGSGTPTGAASAGPTQAAGDPTEPSGGEPTDAPDDTAAPTTGGGGGTTSTACQLVTAEEAGGVLGQTGLTISMDSPGEVSYCIYSDSAGAAVIASSLMSRGGSATFSIWKAGAGVQEVDGLGDDAVFDPSSATLLVLKGEAIFSVTAGDGTQAEAQRIEWAKALAEIAIGRL